MTWLFTAAISLVKVLVTAILTRQVLSQRTVDPEVAFRNAVR